MIRVYPGRIAAALVVTVGLIGAPHRAQAQIDNSALTCGTSATFFPRGDHWAVQPLANPADGPIPITYRQQKDGPPNIPGGETLDAVFRAFETWMNHRCTGNVYPNIYIADAISIGLETEDYPTRDRGDTYQGENLQTAQNIVYFVTNAAGWKADANTVALTTNLFIPDTGMIVTADMEFNDINFDFRAKNSSSAFVGCSSGTAKCYDVESVALHEAGHFLGFNHVTCAEAIMFPHGTGTDTRTALSLHEQTGLCTVYKPRPASPSTARVWMEQCTANNQCPDNLCITPKGLEGTPWGFCSKACTQNTDCGTGFVCGQQEGGTIKFCKPGVNGTGAGVVGAADPGTGQSNDFCAPCSTGADCVSGVCVDDGAGAARCTQTCVSGSLPGSGSQEAGSACPANFECTPTDTEWSVCWPQNETACAGGFGAAVNEVCFREVPNSTDYLWAPCEAGLICFGFRPRCAGQEGACVSYCNATDTQCASGLTCCYGVEEDGTCITSPTPQLQHGGCFDLREIGQGCVAAEQSVCLGGSGCFHFGDPTLAECFQTCDTGTCSEGTSCVEFGDECDNTFSLCCKDGGIASGICEPGDVPALYDVGIECTTNEECDSGRCQKFDGEAACSRTCNPVTGVGCPGGNEDVNGDGIEDGGFTCRLISGEGWCWPNRGPIDPPAGPPVPEEPGCCSAVGRPLGPGELIANLMVWLPLWWLVRRRRRG